MGIHVFRRLLDERAKIFRFQNWWEQDLGVRPLNIWSRWCGSWVNTWYNGAYEVLVSLYILFYIVIKTHKRTQKLVNS